MARDGAERTIVSPRDASTHAIEFIDYAHHEVHSGKHFTYSFAGTGVNVSGTVDRILTTADTATWAHIIVNAYGALHSKLQIYEDTTFTATTAEVAVNNNRNKLNAAGLAINLSGGGSGGTPTTGNLLIEVEWGVDTGVGTNRVASGGDQRADQEWVLKQGTVYLIRLESETAANNLSANLSWYEHADKE